MRSLVIALALMALPVLAAQKEIMFKCEQGVCFLLEADWKWVMESMKSKDSMLKRCGVTDS